MTKNLSNNAKENSANLPPGHWVDDSPDVFETMEDVREMEQILEQQKEKLKDERRQSPNKLPS